MNRNMTTVFCTLAAVLTVASALSMSALAADSGSSDTKRRTVTGAAVGGVVVGVATGSAGWAAVGAIAGGTGGYLYDKNKKNEEKAYEKGVKEGQSSKSK
jgi:osmotically inducible lipoprotein OsmB